MIIQDEDGSDCGGGAGMEPGGGQLISPPNFGVVDFGIYRSSYPRKEHLQFVRKLHLRSIIYLCKEPYSNQQFADENKIRVFNFGMEGGKSDEVPEATVREALQVLLNIDNYPLLIHCNRGKHRTGCLVACYRKVLGCSLSSIIQEYMAYAREKFRTRDIDLITSFDPSKLETNAMPGAFFCLWFKSCVNNLGLRQRCLRLLKQEPEQQQQQQQQQQQSNSY